MKKIFNPEYRYNRQKRFPDIPDEKWNNWQWQIDNRITDSTKLKTYFSNIDTEAIESVAKRFSFSVTPYFLSLINDDIPLNDPVGKQVIPDIREFQKDSRLILDPFKEEKERSPIPGVVQRYPDRIILVTTNFVHTRVSHCKKSLCRLPLMVNHCLQYSLQVAVSRLHFSCQH